MRQAVSTRQSNIDATLDARDDQVAKTNQRAVARSQRITGRVLAYIAWNLTSAGVDTSQGVICDENGNSTLATIQIDAIASIVNCQPQSFGYALYEVTIVGTRSNVPTYAATRVSSIAPAAGLGLAKVLGGIDSSNRLLDTSSALIQVTIGGAATNSILPSFNTVPVTIAAGTPIEYVPNSGAVNFAVNVTTVTIPAVYGIIQWDAWPAGSASSDYSQAEICNADGSRITGPTIVYIDYTSGIRPQFFGNVAYELELIGNVTRSGTSKPCYRARWQIAGSKTGTAGRTGTCVGTPTTDSKGGFVVGATIGDSASAAITTTINGVAVNNTLPLLLAVANASGDVIDLSSPLGWGLSGTISSVAWLCLTPAYAISNRLGGMLAATPDVYDTGEVVVIQFWATYTITGASAPSSIQGTLIVAVAVSPSGIGRGLNSEVPSSYYPQPATWSATMTSGSISPLGITALGLTLAFTRTAGGKYNNPVLTVSQSGVGAITSVFVIVGGRGPNWAGVG
jgi:hypothetical protein